MEISRACLAELSPRSVLNAASAVVLAVVAYSNIETAKAATLDVNAYAAASGVGFTDSGLVAVQIVDTTRVTRESSQLEPTASVLASARYETTENSNGQTLDTRQANASASLDVRTGEAKIFAQANGASFYGESNASTFAILTEVLTFQGTGSAAMVFEFDGFWNTANQLNLEASICAFCFSSGNRQLGSTSLGTSVGRVTDEVLRLPFSVVDGLSGLFSWTLAATVVNGFADFSNTGRMYIETSSGVTYSSGDPNFLSEPAFLGEVEPVPLPAALPLFGFALSLMGLLGWRRKRLAMA